MGETAAELAWERGRWITRKGNKGSENLCEGDRGMIGWMWLLEKLEDLEENNCKIPTPVEVVKQSCRT